MRRGGKKKLFGCVAVGPAAKPLAPRFGLGFLQVTVTSIDTLCGIFVQAGIEGVDPAGASSIPWSLIGFGLTVGPGRAGPVAHDAAQSTGFASGSPAAFHVNTGGGCYGF